MNPSAPSCAWTTTSPLSLSGWATDNSKCIFSKNKHPLFGVIQRDRIIFPGCIQLIRMLPCIYKDINAFSTVCMWVLHTHLPTLVKCLSFSWLFWAFLVAFLQVLRQRAAPGFASPQEKGRTCLGIWLQLLTSQSWPQPWHEFEQVESCSKLCQQFRILNIIYANGGMASQSSVLPHLLSAPSHLFHAPYSRLCEEEELMAQETTSAHLHQGGLELATKQAFWYVKMFWSFAIYFCSDEQTQGFPKFLWKKNSKTLCLLLSKIAESPVVRAFTWEVIRPPVQVPALNQVEGGIYWTREGNFWKSQNSFFHPFWNETFCFFFFQNRNLFIFIKR